MVPMVALVTKFSKMTFRYYNFIKIEVTIAKNIINCYENKCSFPLKKEKEKTWEVNNMRGDLAERPTAEEKVFIYLFISKCIIIALQ